MYQSTQAEHLTGPMNVLEDEDDGKEQEDAAMMSYPAQLQGNTV